MRPSIYWLIGSLLLTGCVSRAQLREELRQRDEITSDRTRMILGAEREIQDLKRRVAEMEREGDEVVLFRTIDPKLQKAIDNYIAPYYDYDLNRSTCGCGPKSYEDLADEAARETDRKLKKDLDGFMKIPDGIWPGR